MKIRYNTQPAEPDLGINNHKTSVGRLTSPQRSEELELERLKTRLLRQALEKNESPMLVTRLRRAANEAAGIAWLEPHPLLVFPTLFEEKALHARRSAFRQETIRARSSDHRVLSA